jgi:hypothetical protein
MVGEEEVQSTGLFSGLRRGEGIKSPLKPLGYFHASPHP